MCVIACKPAGVALPSDDIIRNMFEANPHGAGFMYADNGVVRIEKGFMKLDAFMDALKRAQKTTDLTKTGVVLHFRITTHGGTMPENTHPFPISDSIGVLKKLKSTCKVGVAHNGIIDIHPRSKDISDTMEYIASQLAPLSRAVPEWYKNKDLMLMVENAIDSKLAILTGDGVIRTIGKFNEDEGVLYSNFSWQGYGSYRNVYSFGSYSSGGWYDEYDAEGYSVVNRSLMAVSDAEGSYIRDCTTGDMFEDDEYEYFIDEFGTVYWYSWDKEDGAVAVPDYVALNGNGTALKYDPELAEPMYVYL